MSELKNDVFLKALLMEETPYTPVWMMRQAGRYLPEYRETRKKAGSFLDLCKNVELATEVTMQPIDRFPLDAAIIFSDILTVPNAMGLGLHFVEGEGPKFERPIRTEEDVEKLPLADMADLQYVFDVAASCRKALNGRVPLIGFSGSPFTLLSYMIEGGASKDYRLIKTMMLERPELYKKLSDKVTDSVTRYLTEQINAGVDAIQIFDSWGGVLNPWMYREHSLEPMKKIIANLPEKSPITGRKVPKILFTKGGAAHSLDEMANSGANCVGLDWTCDIGLAKDTVGDRCALQGNMDPMVLMGGEKAIESEVKRILDAFGKRKGHVFNLGHGISLHTDPAMAGRFVELVHELSAK